MDCQRCSKNIKLARYQLGRETQRVIFVIHIYVDMKQLLFMDKQPFEKHFDYDKMAFTPDLIIGHSGFGNTLYLKEVWPNAKFVGYFEWFYRSHGSDVGFGKESTPKP